MPLHQNSRYSGLLLRWAVRLRLDSQTEGLSLLRLMFAFSLPRPAEVMLIADHNDSGAGQFLIPLSGLPSSVFSTLLKFVYRPCDHLTSVRVVFSPERTARLVQLIFLHIRQTFLLTINGNVKRETKTPSKKPTRISLPH